MMIANTLVVMMTITMNTTAMMIMMMMVVMITMVARDADDGRPAPLGDLHP